MNIGIVRHQIEAVREQLDSIVRRSATELSDAKLLEESIQVLQASLD